MKTTTPVRVEPTPEMIAIRAYQRFLARGGEHGHALEDWLAAEEDLRAELAPTAPVRRLRTNLRRVK